MAGNSGRTAKQRGPGRPFRPGQSGNPNGRPKAHGEFVEACRARTPKALEVLDQEMELGDSRVQAAIKVLEWAWGKPATAPEDREAMTATTNGLAELSTAEIVAAVRALNGKAHGEDGQEGSTGLS